MTTASPLDAAAPGRAAGTELLGPLTGSGYRGDRFLVRRADGQVLQLTPLLYALLDLLDGRRTADQLATALSDATGRTATAHDVEVLQGKLAALGLVAGSEPASAPRANPLLALRWKVLVTDPRLTRAITSPLAFLFRPWLLWPVLVAFAGVCWFVLMDKGLASATTQAFDQPGLLLAVFALAVASAGVHELGHGAACRYGGATPGGMGAGLYLVWPAFYTDVSDAYRLDRRGRLRVDLGGLYFNAVIAVAVVGVWLAVRRDALLLLVAMQLLQMLRQLSPVVRADGYHILSDLTGVPDLYAHLGPTLRRLLPSGRREPSPLTRRATVLVVAWVLVVVPVLLSMLIGAVLLLPRLAASAWASGRHQGALLEAAVPHLDLLGATAALLRLVALALPVVGTVLISSKVLRTTGRRAWLATAGRPLPRAAVVLGAAALAAGLAWAWWPNGQYTPVRPQDRGTLPALVSTLRQGRVVPAADVGATKQLALVMTPCGGATAAHPALLLLHPGSGRDVQAVLADGGHGLAFPLTLPAAPRPGETQALAVGTRDGAVTYDVAYALVTVSDGRPVTQASTAYALATCKACTTVAVTYQVVLVVGHASVVAPADVAVAGNARCPQCMTTALAAQLVVTLNAEPPAELKAKLLAALRHLDGLSRADLRDPAAVVAAVQQVRQQVTALLDQSGLVTGTAADTSSAGTTVPSSPPSATPGASPAAVDSPQPSPADASPATASSEPSAAASPAASPDPATPAASPSP